MSAADPGSRVGDFIVTFQHTPRVSVGRSDARWRVIFSTDGCTVLAQAPSETWLGFPFDSQQAGDRNLWLLGELYPRAEHKNTLVDVANRRGSPGLANGHFLLFAWDATVRKLHVWTNRFGTLHAYHAWDGRRGAIGTYSSSVAAHASSRKLDWLGWTGFFAMGFFPENRTQFEDVRILRPACHYMFDDRGRIVEERRYWEWRHEPDPRRSYADTVDEFRAVLDVVMADLSADGRIAVPISGGLDSRTTVASLCHGTGHPDTERPLWAYSYGYFDGSVETKIAAQVARASGLMFRPFTIKPYLFDKLERVVSAVEGFQDVTKCRQAAVVEELASNADSVIAAHWGDVWLDDMGFVGGRHRYGSGKDEVLSHAMTKVLKEGRAWLLDHICRKQFGDDCESAVAESIRCELNRVAHIEDPDFRIKAFKTEQWSFRATTASLRVFQGAVFPRLPFYDLRMADFLCTVPTEFVRGRKLQIDYLITFAEDLAKITWQDYDTNLLHYKYFNTLLVPKRAFKKFWRALTRRQIVERNWELQFLNERGRKELERRLLTRGQPVHDFVDPDTIRELIDSFYRAPFVEQRGYTISMLLTFSTWLPDSL